MESFCLFTEIKVLLIQAPHCKMPAALELTELTELSRVFLTWLKKKKKKKIAFD